MSSRANQRRSRSWRWAGSVRVRSAFVSVLVVGAVFVPGALGVASVLRSSLYTSATSTAKADAYDITSLIATRGHVPAHLPISAEDMAAQVVGPSGKVLASSRNVTGQPAMAALRPGSGNAATRAGVVLHVERFAHVDLDLDSRFVVAAVGYQGRSFSGTVLVADSLGAADHAVFLLKLVLGIALPLLALLVGFLVWVLTGWSLRPVEQIRSQVAGLSALDLHRRVPEPAVQDEIGRLARTMNAMLGRLEVSSDRQRQLVGDVSHELRNPLASLRAQLEIAAAHPGRNTTALLQGSIAEVDRLSQLVDDLLTLARLDEDPLSLRLGPVDLDDMALAHADRLRARGKVEVSVAGVGAARVDGDEARLTRVVANLADNAERHARGRVEFAVSRQEDGVLLSVTDDGPGIAVADRERIFERFVRLDSARAHQEGGAGLGLAIVAEIVRAHGGKVWVEDAEPGARFVVQLPLCRGRDRPYGPGGCSPAMGEPGPATHSASARTMSRSGPGPQQAGPVRSLIAWARAGLVVLGVMAAALVAVATFRAPDLSKTVGSVTLANAASPAVRIVISARSSGRISPYLFGANLLWPYNAEGAFDPRTDRFFPSFISQVEQLGITALRYPAGTTADSFNWLRAIGPQAQRRPNEPYGMQDGALSKLCCTLAGPAASTVGPDEFGRLLDQTGAVGDIIVNFVTGTAQEAADFVAYMTAPPSAHPSRNPKEASYWAALRDRNGHRLPYPVPYWEVGNEQYSAGQLGWRSGRVISVGRHRAYCPTGSAPVCLYAFGGTTAFVDQRVGVFADNRPGRSRSTGAARQQFFVYFPPVVPRSQVVYVAGRPWRAVRALSSAGPRAEVYQFTSGTGEITFGSGRHGAIPPRGTEIRVSYYSGPHGGFVQFYDAMKKMNHRISVCETEDSNTVFLRAMGRTYPYDCVELHKYVHPTDLRAPILRFEENLIYAPIGQGASVSRLQRAVRRYSGKNVPVVLSEYGQLVAPVPAADPRFNLSLYEGLLVASQLRQWVDHNLPVAEKYLLNSAPFLDRVPSRFAINPVGLSVDNAMIAGPGPPFVMEPTGAALALMSRLAGAQRLGSTVVGGPAIIPAPGLRVPVLQTLAASSHRQLDIFVINVSPTTSVRAKVQLGYSTAPSNMTVSVLDGPSTTAYNTFSRPRLVKVVTRVTRVRGRNLSWTFPAHSLTLFQLGLDRDKPSSARGFRSRQWKLVLIPGRGGSLTPGAGTAEHPRTPLVPERPQGGNISTGWLLHPG